MIAAMEAMKEISALRRLALTSNSLVLERVIAYLNRGFAMVTMIVSISR